jgi:hypothetical protein
VTELCISVTKKWTLTSIYHLPVLHLDGDSEAPDLDRCRVLLRRQKNTMRFDISMNYVILMAVAKSFQYLPHVMAARQKHKQYPIDTVDIL